MRRPQNLKKSSTCLDIYSTSFDIYSVNSKQVGDFFFHFCGLLTMSKLYKMCRSLEIFWAFSENLNFLHNLAYKIRRIQLQFITFLLNLRNYASLLLKITYQIDKSINKGCISKNFKEQTTSKTHVFHISRFQTSNE